MTDKNLLWWILKAMDEHDVTGLDINMMLRPATWERIGAPHWVFPSIEAAVNEFAEEELKP